MNVSNFHNPAGWEISTPTRLFSARITAFDYPNVLFVSAVGQSLTKPEWRCFRRALVAARRRGVGQAGMVRLLSAQIRAVADRNLTVGKDLLATCFPVGAIARGYAPPSFVMKGPPSTNEVTFIDLPEKTSDQVWHQPHVVSPGVRLTSIRLEKVVRSSRQPKKPE